MFYKKALYITIYSILLYTNFTHASMEPLIDSNQNNNIIIPHIRRLLHKLHGPDSHQTCPDHQDMPEFEIIIKNSALTYHDLCEALQKSHYVSVNIESCDTISFDPETIQQSPVLQWGPVEELCIADCANIKGYQLCKFISHYCPLLRTLYLRNIDFLHNPAHQQRIAPSVTKLILENCPSIHNPQTLARLLQVFPNLEILDISSCPIAQVACIQHAQLSKLKIIKLNKLPITDRDIEICALTIPDSVSTVHIERCEHLIYYAGLNCYCYRNDNWKQTKEYILEKIEQRKKYYFTCCTIL
jgi:hypothetical protein